MWFLNAIDPRPKDLNVCCTRIRNPDGDRQLHEALLAILPLHGLLNERFVRRNEIVGPRSAGTGCLKEVTLPEKACASMQQLPGCMTNS